MSDPEFLDADELHKLTGFARATSQCVWLQERSIPHRCDIQRVIVSRFHIQRASMAAERLGLLRERIEPYILKPDAAVTQAGQYPPDGEFSGIYMLFDKDGRTTYIGQSVGVGYRNVQHFWAVARGERLPFVEYAAIPVPDLLRVHMEVAHIHALTPPENSLPRVQWDRHDEAVKLIQEVWGPKQ